MKKWFQQAKLGIFIHWGIYAVDGVNPSWDWIHGNRSRQEYYKQLEGFTAEHYDPKDWAKYIKAAGAKYAVLTTKHHDGFCLFDTAYTDLNAIKAAPCAKELVAPYCEALREQGIRVGLYQTLFDSADDDCLQVALNLNQEEIEALKEKRVDYQSIWGRWTYQDAEGEEKERLNRCWEKAMERFRGELRELMERHQPDLMWFDLPVTREGFSWEFTKVKKMMQDIYPSVICNGRLGEEGDYETPEDFIPLRPTGNVWELCVPFNDNWGYAADDHHYKSIKQVVRMLCECITKGGNLLIGIGPDAQGRIPEEDKEKMLELGRWINQYEEAIFPTQSGLDPAYFQGGSTLSEDKKTLYLFVYDCSSGLLMLNGIRNPIKRVTAMGTGTNLSYERYLGANWLVPSMPGPIWISLPKEDMDEVCTVIKMEFDEPIDLVDPDFNVLSQGGFTADFERS